MYIYISWCWLIDAELHVCKVTLRDNHRPLNFSLSPILNTVSRPKTGISNDPFESIFSHLTWIGVAVLQHSMVMEFKKPPWHIFGVEVLQNAPWSPDSCHMWHCKRTVSGKYTYLSGTGEGRPNKEEHCSWNSSLKLFNYVPVFHFFAFKANFVQTKFLDIWHYLFCGQKVDS